MIIQYLEYLKEMSRKIVQSSGFENVLTRSKCYYRPLARSADASFQHYLLDVYEHLHKEQGQKLFCGAGIIVGSVKHGGQSRRVAGPLLYCLAECFKEENI